MSSENGRRSDLFLFYGKWALFPLLESILLQIKTMLGRPFCERMYGTRLYVWLILAMTAM